MNKSLAILFALPFLTLSYAFYTYQKIQDPVVVSKPYPNRAPALNVSNNSSEPSVLQEHLCLQSSPVEAWKMVSEYADINEESFSLSRIVSQFRASQTTASAKEETIEVDQNFISTPSNKRLVQISLNFFNPKSQRRTLPNPIAQSPSFYEDDDLNSVIEDAAEKQLSPLVKLEAPALSREETWTNENPDEIAVFENGSIQQLRVELNTVQSTLLCKANEGCQCMPFSATSSGEN